jgi:hypothetical protein
VSVLIVASRQAFPTLVPTQIAGCQAWYDAADASSFTFSAGSTVSQWNDKSGNSRHVTQGTDAVRPERTGTQNGLSTVQFASGDKMTTGALGVPICAAAFTIFAVFKKTGAANTFECFPVTLTDATFNARPFDRYNARKIIGNGTATQVDLADNVPADMRVRTTMAVHTVSAADVGDSSTEYLDEQTTVWSSSAFTTAWSTASQRITVAGRGESTTKFTGDVAEIIIYDTVLSTTDRYRVGGYLRGKWGTA